MPLNAPRHTMERGRDLLTPLVAANVVIHQGSLVALNAAGFAVPGSVATTLKAAGRAQYTAHNLGGAAGVMRVEVKRGVFYFRNHQADPLLPADTLADCYIVDDETVAKTNGGNTRSKAGRALEIDEHGVWVEII